MGTVMTDQVQEFELNLTGLAAAKIQGILHERGVPEHGLRVFVSGGGCSGLQYGLALEAQAQEDDAVVKAGGVTLYIDPVSAEYLHGATIDYEDNSTQAGFRIDAPNAASTCGCGSGGCGCG